MVRKEIDYSSTLIYKITCNDPAVTDIYVGHTTDFVQRRAAHKQSALTSNCKLYKIIRANGGWLNWTMEILNFYNCKNLHEAKTKEQEYFVTLQANLNSIEPVPTPKVKEVKPFSCETCNTTFKTTVKLQKHQKRCTLVKEVKEVATLELSQTLKYGCTVCDFKCSKQSNYNAHLLTKKHLKLIEKQAAAYTKTNKLACNKCNKIYEARSSLWYHEQKCNYKSVNTENALLDIKNLLTEVIRVNTETTKQYAEMMKQNAEIMKQNIELLNNNNTQ